MPHFKSSISAEVRTLSTALSQSSHCSWPAWTLGTGETLGLAAGTVASSLVFSPPCGIGRTTGKSKNSRTEIKIVE